MIIEELTVTAFQQHTRILGCEKTRQAICIDPGDEAERIVETLERHGLTLQAIALTHAHLDHVGGVAALKQLQPVAQINLHRDDEFMYRALPEQPAWIGIPRSQWAALGFAGLLAFGGGSFDDLQPYIPIGLALTLPVVILAMAPHLPG